MTISHVGASPSATNSGVTRGPAVTATTTADIAAGDTIVVSVSCSNLGDTSNLASVTDSAGNTYVSAAFSADPGQNTGVYVWYCTNCLHIPNGSTVTVTFNTQLLASGESWEISVDDLNGAATASVVDATANHNSQAIGSTGTWDTNSITTTNAHDMLWVAMAVTQGEPAAFTNGASLPASGWTIQTGLTNGPSNHNALRTAYQAVTATGTYKGGGTSQAFSAGVSAAIVAFKEAVNNTITAQPAVLEMFAPNATVKATFPITAQAALLELFAVNAALGGSGAMNAQAALLELFAANAVLQAYQNLVQANPAVIKLLAQSATLHGASIPPPFMPLISLNAPAYASDITYAPSRADNSTYGDFWRSVSAPSVGTPHWLAYDLSGVAANQRKQVLVNLINEGGNQYYNVDTSQAQSLFADYKLQGNAATGGSLPGSGWVDLVTVTGNLYPGRTHQLDLTSYNWLRFICTAANGTSPNNDVSIQMDVHDAHLSYEDTWLFIGDSITHDGMLHPMLGGGDWGYGGSVSNIINTRTGGQYYPAYVDGGNVGWTMAQMRTDIGGFLANFNGGFVSIALGTNDCNIAGAVDTAAFYANLLFAIDAVRSALPDAYIIVPYIPWGSSQNLAANSQAVNAYVDAHLHTDRPSVFRGPDFWTFFNNNQTLIRTDDHLHPTFTEVAGAASGYEAMHQLWATWMVQNVYLTETLHAQAAVMKLSALNAVLNSSYSIQVQAALIEMYAAIAHASDNNPEFTVGVLQTGTLIMNDPILKGTLS